MIMLCVKCGSEIPDGSDPCPKCGAENPAVPKTADEMTDSGEQTAEGSDLEARFKELGLLNAEKPKSSNMIMIVSLIIIAAVLVIGAVFFFTLRDLWKDYDTAVNRLGEIDTALKEGISELDNGAGDYIGKWVDSWSRRARMDIKASSEPGQVDINIYWGSSYDRRTHWSFTAVYDEENDCMKYENGLCYNEMDDGNGNSGTEQMYSDGKGRFYFGEDGKMRWDDETEHAGDECTFERAQEFELD